MANLRAGILGTGHAYPEGILTNADLEKTVETSDEWITTRTGIKQRRKAAAGEYTSLFAARMAAKPATLIGVMADSAPPQIITSAASRWIILKLSPIA